MSVMYLLGVSSAKLTCNLGKLPNTINTGDKRNLKSRYQVSFLSLWPP